MDTWWVLNLFSIYLDVAVGMNICTMSALSGSLGSYDCAMETYYLEELINWSYFSKFGNLMINTCGKEEPGWVKSQRPGGPEHGDSKSRRRFETVEFEPSTDDAFF